jgi:hypothetical protein
LNDYKRWCDLPGYCLSDSSSGCDGLPRVQVSGQHLTGLSTKRRGAAFAVSSKAAKARRCSDSNQKEDSDDDNLDEARQWPSTQKYQSKSPTESANGGAAGSGRAASGGANIGDDNSGSDPNGGAAGSSRAASGGAIMGGDSLGSGDDTQAMEDANRGRAGGSRAASGGGRAANKLWSSGMTASESSDEDTVLPLDNFTRWLQTKDAAYSDVPARASDVPQETGVYCYKIVACKAPKFLQRPWNTATARTPVRLFRCYSGFKVRG